MVKTSLKGSRAADAAEAPETTLASASTADTAVGAAAATDRATEVAIGEAVAGRRPLPTPETEGAAAIADAPIDPRPGSGTLDERPAYVPLTLDEIAALDACLALLPAADLDLIRAELAKAPIDPVKGQGTLDGDHQRWLDNTAQAVGRLHGALTALGQGRAVPPVAELDARFALDPEKGPYLRIRSTRDGHRRAGRSWTVSAQFVAARDFTDAEIAALQTDPAIIVEDV